MLILGEKSSNSWYHKIWKKNSKSNVWNANLLLYFHISQFHTMCDYKFHVNANVNIVSYLQSFWFIHKSCVWMQISTLYLLASYKFLIHSFTLACVNVSLMWMQMLTTYFKFTKFTIHSHISHVNFPHSTYYYSQAPKSALFYWQNFSFHRNLKNKKGEISPIKQRYVGKNELNLEVF